MREEESMSYGKITQKQQEILEYIKSEILNRGFPPAVREICEAVNLKSTSLFAFPIAILIFCGS